jgi:hypothetical protein
MRPSKSKITARMGGGMVMECRRIVGQPTSFFADESSASPDIFFCRRIVGAPYWRMLSLRKPSPERLRGCLESWSDAPLSYTPPLGDGFIADEHAVRLGSGEAAYRDGMRGFGRVA